MNSKETILNMLKSVTSKEEVLCNSPGRIEKAYRDILGGSVDRARDHGKVTFPSVCTALVDIKNIAFYSMCEHHLLPFFGVFSVRYRPNGKILGLSKFPRIIQELSKTLTVQEDLTHLVYTILCESLGTTNLEVISEARHLCTEMRGVAMPGGVTMVSIGSIQDEP